MVACVSEDLVNESHLLLHRNVKPSKLADLNSSESARKIRKNSRKQRKKVTLSEDEKDHEVDSQTNNRDLEQELLESFYESVTETCGLTAAEITLASFSNVSCSCELDEVSSEDELLETDLDYVFSKYSSEISFVEGSLLQGTNKWKNNKSQRLKKFCKQMENPCQLKLKRRKNVVCESFAACKREILKNRNKNENVRNRKDNIECKLKMRNFVRRCPNWQPKYEESNIEAIPHSTLKPKKRIKDQSKCAKRVEKRIKKLRKFVLTSSNAKKGLLQSGSVKKLIELQNRDLRPDDFDVLVQLDLAEIKRRESKKKKRSKKHDSVVDSSLVTKPVKRKSQTNSRGANHAEKKKLDKFILQTSTAPKTADDNDFINKLINLQEREITPEDFDLLLQLDSSVVPKTVNKSVVDGLRTDKYEIENGIAEICTICMEDYKDGCVRKYLPCGHVFHSSCIRTWLTTTSTKCPVDNLDI